jgi:hypothetical protein
MDSQHTLSRISSRIRRYKKISQDVAGTIIASLHACYLLFVLLILVFRVDCNEIKISCLLHPGFGKIDPALVTRLTTGL